MLSGYIFMAIFHRNELVVWSNNEQEALESLNALVHAERAAISKPAFLQLDEKWEYINGEGINLTDLINLGNKFEVDPFGKAIFTSPEYTDERIFLEKGLAHNLTSEREISKLIQQKTLESSKAH